MSELTTDLNREPYYDDFDEEKNFHRILFKPETAVQAREITQIQSILQNQVSRFGNHVFKDGSVVKGVTINYRPNFDYVHVSDQFNDENLVNVSEISPEVLITNSTDSDTAVRAIAKVTVNGFETTFPNTNRLYLRYVSTGKDDSNNDVYTFGDSDTLYIFNENQNKLGSLDANNITDSIDVLSSNAVGQGYGISVSDGIIYQKGHFVRTEAQTVIVKPFDQEVSNFVCGFTTNEEIITAIKDNSLYDQSAGFSNFNAPGADRLKLTPLLISFSEEEFEEVADPDFFPIIQFGTDNEAVQQENDTIYNKLGDEFARRTSEQHGDFYIKPFQIEAVPARSNTENFFSYQVSPGIAYVNGYRVEYVGSTRVSVPRALATAVSQNQIITANYGKYVVCNEFLGSFDLDNLGEVELYDTPQTSISQYEGISSAPSGTLVGRANVKSVIYNSGDKDKPDAEYLVYLFNIRMETGRSFSNDVKSLYASIPRAFKADIVLENGRANLKDLARQKLVFRTGLDGIRRLTDENGNNDTNYIYRQTSSATLQSNGVATFTINTAAPGATESLAFSVGQLSDALENEFNFTFSQNAFTQNLSGTIEVQSGNTTLLGSGTSFDTDFSDNDLIRINIDGSSFQLRRIVGVVNSTVMEIDTDISDANASANYQRYFVDGQTLDLSGPDGTITILSNTQFTVATGLDFDSGTQTLFGQYPVQRNTALGARKQIHKERLVKIDPDSNSNGLQGPWNLGFVDVNRIRNVWVGSTYANTNPDRLDWFQLDNGQRDEFYEHARLFVRPEHSSKITSSTKILVNLDHFTANTSAGVGFFSVDSYPIDDTNTANTTGITTAEIPIFNSSDGRRIDLRNAIDFRPVKFNTAASINTSDPANTSISENPVGSNNSFDTATGGQYLADVDSRFVADIEYYLPRIDMITISKEGDLNVTQGEPEVNPRTPFVEGDVSAIGTAYVPPFPSLHQREAEQFNRRDLKVRVNLQGNKRYTKRDIGRLEKRIERLEYYTVLNALEQQAKDLTIPDANGLDRFKNGIFADPFNSHNIGRVNDFEYKIAIDKDENIARPFFKKHAADFQYVSALSTGVVRTGPYITRTYTNELFIKQKYATKFRNATELEWQWNGQVFLYPDNDHFSDESQAPNINVDLDFATPWEQFANSPFGTIYGDWRTIAETSRTDIDNAIDFRAGGDTITETTTTTTNQRRTVDNIDVNTLVEQYDLGSYVSDFSIQPYMRSREIAFVATGLRPNTRMYMYFDSESVTEDCAPGERSGIEEFSEGKEDRIVHRIGNFGDPIFTDSDGTIIGKFRLPDNTFRVGDRKFLITNVDDIIFGEDAKLSKAEGVFTASNVSVTKQNTTITTRQPRLVFSSSNETQTLTNTDTRTTFVPWPPPPPPPPPAPPAPPDDWIIEEDLMGGDGGAGDGGDGGAGDGGDGGAGDGCPISQSFLVRTPSGVSGTFMSQLGLFFRSKDPNLGVTIYVMEMRAGYPDINSILGTAYLSSDQINAPGGTTQEETVFTFDYPIYLSKNKYYAFMIFPDSVSPEYTFWLSELGELDVESGVQVFQNPSAGTAFRSANQYTWTALQDEDVKFNLYRADFDIGAGTAIFQNEDDEYITVDGFERANSNIGVQIGQVVYTVNASSNNTLVGNNDPFGVIQRVDEANGYIELDSSRGGFAEDDIIRIYSVNDEEDETQITSSNLVATANIEDVMNLPYHAVVPRFSTIKPERTSMNFAYRGTDSLGIIDSTGIKVQNNTDTEYFDRERFLYSKSNEEEGKTSRYDITMDTASRYVSPVIDLGRKSGLFIENIINNDTTDEHTRYGAAETKYVSKVAILDDGQEAEDIKLYLTAYRPADTDIKMYIKVQNPEDGEPFDDKMWTELQYENGSEFVFSNPSNPSDFIEYEFSVPNSTSISGAAFRDPSTGVIEYTREDGVRFLTFKSYSIKIVLLSSNPVRIPRLNDVRAICLQV